MTSFQVIEHVERVEPFLCEIRRVLRDAGIAVFTTPNRCIRLEPGMKPWNRFHVREYEAAELGEILRGVFPNVSVEGLFAVPELYKIEHDRVGRAKTTAAGRPATIPVEVVEPAALVEFIARWSLSDLFYQHEDLDEALDLIAICSMNGSLHRRATSDHRQKRNSV